MKFIKGFSCVYTDHKHFMGSYGRFIKIEWGFMGMVCIEGLCSLVQGLGFQRYLPAVVLCHPEASRVPV